MGKHFSFFGGKSCFKNSGLDKTDSVADMYRMHLEADKTGVGETGKGAIAQ